MSIASMIQANTQEQGKQFSALTQSLADLGKQVTLQLERKEYVKQAQEQLPYMQQAMRDAMNRISSGDVAGGYSEAMMSLPLASQNPIIATAAKTYFAGMQQAAEFQQKAAWQTLQQDMLARKYSGGGVTFTPPTPEELADPNYDPSTAYTRTTPSSGGIPAITRGGGGGGGGQILSAFADEADAVDQQATDSLPAFAAGRDMQPRFVTPEEVPTETGTTMAPGAEQTMSFGLRQQPPPPEAQEKIAKGREEWGNKTPEQQQKISDKLYVTEAPEGYQIINYQSILDPSIKGIAGPPPTQKVTKTKQKAGPKGIDFEREMEPYDPTKTTVDVLRKAEETVAYDNTLSSLYKSIDGKMSRVTTKRNQESEDPEKDTYRIYVDGKEMPDKDTDFNGAKAMRYLASMDSDLNTYNLRVIVSEEAPAEPAQKAERFPVKAKAAEQKPTPAAPAAMAPPQPTTPPPAGIPVADWEKLTPAERERIMTEKIRGAIGTGVGAVMRGGKAILRGARSIR